MQAERDATSTGHASMPQQQVLQQPAWYSPRRLMAFFCVIIFITWLDQGLFASNSVTGNDDDNQPQGVKEAFGLSSFQLGLLPAMYAVGLFVMSFVISELAKTFNAFRLIGMGVALWCLGAVLTGASQSYGMLLAARTIVGSGEASLLTLTFTFVDDVAPPARKSLWFGVLGVFPTVGVAAGYVLAGPLVDALGWRGAFFLEAGLGAPLALAAALLPAVHLQLCDQQAAPPKEGPLPSVDEAAAYGSATDTAAYTHAHALRCEPHTGGSATDSGAHSRPARRPTGLAAQDRGALAPNVTEPTYIQLAGGPHLTPSASSSHADATADICDLDTPPHARLLHGTVLSTPPPLSPPGHMRTAHALSTTAASAAATPARSPLAAAPRLSRACGCLHGWSAQLMARVREGQQDIWALVTLPGCLLNNLGYAPVQWALGVMTFWGPKALKEMYGVSNSDTELVLGAIAFVSGVVGTLAGGLALDALGSSLRRGFALQCTAVAVALLCLELAFLVAQDVAGFYVALLFGLTALFVAQAPSYALSMWTVPTAYRPLSQAMIITLQHVLGDVPGPPVVGAIHDATGDWATSAAAGLSYLGLAVLLFGAGWLLTGMGRVQDFRKPGDGSERLPQAPAAHAVGADTSGVPAGGCAWSEPREAVP